MFTELSLQRNDDDDDALNIYSNSVCTCGNTVYFWGIFIKVTLNDVINDAINTNSMTMLFNSYSDFAKGVDKVLNLSLLID